jgi:hypothetical protein
MHEDLREDISSGPDFSYPSRPPEPNLSVTHLTFRCENRMLSGSCRLSLNAVLYQSSLVFQ